MLVFRKHWKDIPGASGSTVLHQKYKYLGRELAMRPGLKRPFLFGTLAKGVLLGRALAVMSGCDRTALGAGSQSGVSSETVSSARALAEAKVRAAQSSYAASQAELLAAQRSLEQLNVTDADGDVPMQTYPADPTIETLTGAAFGKSIRTSAFARRTTGSRSWVAGRSLSCGCFTGAPHAKCGQLGRTLGIECSGV